MSKQSNRIYIALNEPGVLGGIQRVVASLADDLTQLGFDVVVVGVRRAGRGRGGLEFEVPVWYPFPSLRPRALVDRINRGGMKIERFLAPWQMMGIAQIRRVMAEYPGHVIAMDVFTAELFSKVSPALGYKRVVQFHNSFDSLKGLRDMTRLLAASRAFDQLLALTEGDASEFRTLARVPVGSIPNAAPFAAAPASEGRAKRVVSIGRLSGGKNVEMLVRAWGLLSSDLHREWKLTIIGEGPEEARIAAVTRELRLSDSVELIGPSGDVLSVLRDSEVLALSSEFEGLPMVLLEAMSQEVACIATESSRGVRELLSDGCGVLVTLGDVEEFASRLECLLSDEELRRNVAAAALLKSRSFDRFSIARRWVSLLEDGL